MDPVPETAEAIAELQEHADGDLLADLRASAEAVRRLVPACVGMSLSSTARGLTFTLVASTIEAAVLDATQYLEAGPCVDAADTGRVVTFDADHPDDEARWQLFAQASASLGVRSSLTLPVRSGEHTTGSVNLYASTTDAFDGHHGAIAEVFGAWAEGATTNADLGFETRRAARRAPVILEEDRLIALATGYLASRSRTTTHEAADRIRTAAERAGIGVADFAKYVVEFLGLPPDED